MNELAEKNFLYDETGIGSLKNIQKHIEEIENFFRSSYVAQTRKQEFGFIKPEQFEILRDISEFKRKLSEIESGGDFVPNKDSHLEHILGNGIKTTAGAYAINFDRGKYFADENSPSKEFPVEKFERIKADLLLLLPYIKDLSQDIDLMKKEMETQNGYLGNFADFLICDLPTQTTERLKLFNFFRELERGRFSEKIDWEYFSKYLDLEKIREHFFPAN